MRLNTIVLAAAISAASIIPAFAHHGWGGNVDEVTALTGMVTEGVKLAGPHGTMKIMTSDRMVWDITLAPPFRTQSAGLRQDTIPVGAIVTVHGQRNRDPNRLEMKTIQVEYAGKQYNVYPEFVDKVR
jgi:hypothetical protein